MASLRNLLDSRAKDISNRKSLKTSHILSRTSLRNLENPNLKSLQRLIRKNESESRKKLEKPVVDFAKPQSAPIISRKKDSSQLHENHIEEQVIEENAYNENSFDYYTAIEDCPLSRDDVPIVGEAEHCVGYCYCHHCTCGQHTCPGIELKREITAKSAWITSYKQDFKAKLPSEAPVSPKYTVENSQERYKPKYSNLTTTNRDDFKAHTISPQRKQRAGSLLYNLKHTTRSSYSKDFPD